MLRKPGYILLLVLLFTSLSCGPNVELAGDSSGDTTSSEQAGNAPLATEVIATDVAATNVPAEEEPASQATSTPTPAPILPSLTPTPSAEAAAEASATPTPFTEPLLTQPPTSEVQESETSGASATPTAANEQEQPTAAPAVPTPTPAASEGNASEEDVGATGDETVQGIDMIEFMKSGGFAGIEEQWFLYSDGRITNKSGAEYQVDPSRIQNLLSEGRDGGFFEMEPSYIPRDGAYSDFFNYTVTMQAGGESHTVTTIEDAPNAPEPLLQLIRGINELLMSLTSP